MKYLYVLIAFLSILLADCCLYDVIISSVDMNDAERSLLHLPKHGVTFTDVLGMILIVVISIAILIELIKLIINE